MKSKNTNLNYEQAINQAISEEMLLDDSVVFIGEDIRCFVPVDMFEGIDEKRVKSTPICENSFTGMAIGAAMTGLRPVVNLNIANFPLFGLRPDNQSGQ